MAARITELTRESPVLSFRADFAPKTIDPEKRTAEVVFSTGVRVLRGGYWSDPYFEELSLDPKHVRMDRLNNGAPLLAAHDGYSLDAVIGVVEDANVDGKRGTATVRFAKDQASEAVWQKVRDGILQNISVGYRVHRLETTDKGDPEAKKWPVRLATDWEPFEVSIVPIGADDGAGFRSAEKYAPNPCRIFAAQHEETRAMADPIIPSMTPAATPAADPTAALVADARQANARSAAAEDKIRRDAADAAALEARERITETLKLVARTQLGDAFADKIIKANTPLDKVRAIVLDELARKDEGTETSNHLRFEAGDDRRDKFIRGAEAWLYERTGLAQMIEEAKANKRVGHLLRDAATDPGEFRGMRMLDLARRSLEIRGLSTKGLHGDRLIRAALEYRGDSGFNATGDFTVLLETAVNKVYLGRYATIPVTWPIWCARKSLNDFRATSVYRPGSFSVLDAVTEQGEVKHKNIPDGSKSSITPLTKGNIIGVSRRALVNDDLGFLNDNASELGAASARTLEADAWGLITANAGVGVVTDGTSNLFHANHANIGSTGAMTIDTLDSLRVKMALQKDPSGAAFLALRPFVLLVPIEMAGTAKVFNTSTGDPTASKSSAVANKVLGLFPGGIVDSPYLSAVSATRVYAFADPNVGPVCAVGFINGQEAPVLTSEQSFQFDGLQMKVTFDYGVAAIDWRGASTCAGV